MSENNGLPPDVARFLEKHIRSVAELEVLLLLRSRAGETLTPATVGRELRIDEGWAAAELEHLARAGLLVESPASSSPSTYHFAEHPPVGAIVDAIADAYARRRVTVINAIVTKPNETLRGFADAFRFRKE